MPTYLTDIPTQAQLEAAHEAIKPYIHLTPVLSNQSINTITGAAIYFKCENLQKIGTFKIRGASYASLALSEEKK